MELGKGTKADRYDRELREWEAALRRSRLSLGTLNTIQATVIAIAITAYPASRKKAMVPVATRKS